MNRLGLRSRLSLSIGLLIAAFAAFFALYFPAEQQKSAIEALEQRGTSVSALLGSLASVGIIASEMGGAEQLSNDLANAARSDQDIDYIVVKNPRGEVVGKYRRSTFSETKIRSSEGAALVLEHDAENLHIHRPLLEKDELVGSLSMGLSTRGVQSAHSESRRTALLVSALIIGIGLVLAWVVSHRLAMPLLRASEELASVSVTLVDSAREQESTSAQEAAAVAETRQSMHTLLDSAQQIAEQSSEVLGNAERNAQSSHRIAGQIDILNTLGDRIAEILATIMQVADKADLLALNASLEGTKAGEAGKGFTLVAAEMRRLAENIMGSVNGIRDLMKEIQLTSQGAAAASQEGQSSSADTAASARQIAKLTQEQRMATEQVIESMTEMSAVLEHTLEAVQRTNEAAGDARRLAGMLFELVGVGSATEQAVND